MENGQIWSKKLHDGSYAVGFFHVDPYFILWDQDDAEAMQMREYDFNFDLKQLGIDGKAMVRDLWRQKDLGEVNGSFQTKSTLSWSHFREDYSGEVKICKITKE